MADDVQQSAATESSKSETPQRWYQNEWVPRWIGATSSLLGAAAILLAAGTYLTRYYGSVALKIDPPLVIEFRCSSESFNASMCFDRARGSIFSHMTVTAAFQLTAVGSDLKSVSISRSTVDVQFGSDDDRYRLDALWTADFVPGQDFNRQQVVTTSLRGGESVSRELWYFPLSVLCPEKPVSEEDCSERQNFLAWTDFWNGELKNRSPSKYFPAKEYFGRWDPVIFLTFRFWDSTGEEIKGDTIGCKVHISESVGKRIRNGSNAHSLQITLPCDPI